MANFLNIDFETPLPGGLVTVEGSEFELLGWSIEEVAMAVQVANYSDTVVRLATETFGRGWSSNEDFVFGFQGLPFDLEIAVFNPGPTPSIVEDFEQLWSGIPEFTFSLAPTEVAAFSTNYGLENFEDFETEWSNSTWLELFSSSDIERFDTVQETFAWGSFSFSLGTTETADFQAPSSGIPDTTAFESFEDQDGGILEWYVQIDVNIGSTSNALFTITINGDTITHQAAGDTASQVRDSLRDQINGLDGVEAQDGFYVARLDIKQTTPLPVQLEISFNVEDPETGTWMTKETLASQGFWSQSGQLTTEV